MFDFKAIFAIFVTTALTGCGGLQIENGELSGEVSVGIPQLSAQATGSAPLGRGMGSSDTTVVNTEGPVWYEEALTYLGTAEKKGTGNSNSLIEEMHNLTKNALGYSDATAWCASFVNYVLATSTRKFDLPENYSGTGSSGARHFQAPDRYTASRSDENYLGWGTNVKIGDLHIGDVVAIIWDDTTKGHAGFVAATYVDDKGIVTGIWVLGGNQRNAANTTETVNVALYMMDEADRIRFKRPVGFLADPAHKALPLTKASADEKFGSHIGMRGNLSNSR